jgi:Na+-transporting methylmalonyl-CoA/oxaloacetate decarboxylase gamma subunit
MKNEKGFLIVVVGIGLLCLSLLVLAVATEEIGRQQAPPPAPQMLPSH